ncbi:MAG: transcription elongation factor GreB [Gammaproteobacteria bacterium]
MASFRAPQPRGSRYITPAGNKRLADELDYLWRVQRPQVTQAVAEAAAQGDRSENAEYIYGKKQLREIDRRVRFLQKRLDELIVVDRIPEDTSRVFFGAWIRLEDSKGEIQEYRVVGPDEFEVKKSWISMDSPIGRAVLKKSAGETVVVQLPKGDAEFTIIGVSYSGFADEE